MSSARSNHAFRGAEQMLEPGMLEQIRLSWRLLRDPRVGWLKNVIPAAAALYLLFPVDAVPDFLPGLGQIDDVGVIIALLAVAVRLIPKLAPASVVEEHLADLRGTRRPEWGEARGGSGDVVEGQYRMRD